MAKNKGEPTLTKIDDYNGNESKQKRNTVRLVVLVILIIGAIFAYLKEPNSEDIKAIEKTQIPAK